MSRTIQVGEAILDKAAVIALAECQTADRGEEPAAENENGK
jgi:hypothetical protein